MQRSISTTVYQLRKEKRHLRNSAGIAQFLQYRSLGQERNLQERRYLSKTQNLSKFIDYMIPKHHFPSQKLPSSIPFEEAHLGPLWTLRHFLLGRLCILGRRLSLTSLIPNQTKCNRTYSNNTGNCNAINGTTRQGVAIACWKAVLTECYIQNEEAMSSQL